MWHIRRKKTYTLHQFANDWVTACEEEQPFNPKSFVYTHEELVRMSKDKSSGIFWALHEPVHDFRYTKHGGIRLTKRSIELHANTKLRSKLANKKSLKEE